MFTLIGYSESQDTSGVLANLAALTDQHVTVNGDDILVPPLNKVIGYHAIGVNFTQGQLSSPSLRRRTLIDIEPGDVGTEPTSALLWHDRFDSPIQLITNEALNFLAAEDAAGASRVTGLVWLGDGENLPIGGDFFTVRATNGSTLTANAWTIGALTFTQTLPAGRYQVVGMRAQSAGLIAARLVFVGGFWRPGCIGTDADGDLDNPRFRYGNGGLWGEFMHNTPPQVEFLSSSADTSQVVHLDLIGPF